MNKIDLHMHSNHSDDGEFSIQHLIDMASESGISMIAIADHNCSDAYLEKYDAKAVQIIPAIELDCCYAGKIFHMLGYGIDASSSIFKQINDDILKQERHASGKRLQLIEDKLHLKIDEEELKKVSPNGVYVPETICEIAMLDERNRHNEYLQAYFPGGKRDDNPYVNFYWDYCSQGKPAYVEIDFMSMKEAIRLLTKQKATIVLAHPGNNVKEDGELMEDIILLGIDGIEVYSSYHNEQQINYYRDYAQEYHLLMSAGSDFHGKTKPNVYMGECRMPKEDENALLSYFQNKADRRIDA